LSALAAQCEKDAKFLLVLADDCEVRAHYARSATQERWMKRPQERSPSARRRRANAAVMGAIASLWPAVKLVSGAHIIADLPLGVGNVIYD
jgi:acetoacetate decarboxylase